MSYKVIALDNGADADTNITPVWLKSDASDPVTRTSVDTEAQQVPTLSGTAKAADISSRTGEVWYSSNPGTRPSKPY